MRMSVGPVDRHFDCVLSQTHPDQIGFRVVAVLTFPKIEDN